MFRREWERLVNEISRELVDFLNDIAEPLTPEINNKHLPNEKNPVYKVILTHLHKLNYQMKDVHNNIFNRPLKENHAKIKFLIGNISRTYRNYFFVLGITFFLLLSYLV
jgi:hypothetical protein